MNQQFPIPEMTLRPFARCPFPVEIAYTPGSAPVISTMKSSTCPDCGSPLIREGRCESCPACGYSSCSAR